MGQPASVGHNSEHIPNLLGGNGGFPSPGSTASHSFSLPHTVHTLEGEFTLVDMHIPTLTVEKVGWDEVPPLYRTMVGELLVPWIMQSLAPICFPFYLLMQRDPSQRLFRVKCTRTDIVATLDITFPAFYPNNAPPFFIIDSLGTNLDTARQQSLLQVGLVCLWCQLL